MNSKIFYNIFIKLKSINKNSLNLLKKRLENSLKLHKIDHFRSINMPMQIKKYNVLRSPHVNKKSRDAFEIRDFSRLFIIKCNSKEQVQLVNTLMCLFNMADLQFKIKLYTSNFKN